MSANSHITLPPDLLPSDGRFGSGPSKIPTFFLEGLADTQATLLGTSHRRPAVKDLVRVIRERMVELFGLPDGYEVVLGNGGATLFCGCRSLCFERCLIFPFGSSRTLVR